MPVSADLDVSSCLPLVFPVVEALAQQLGTFCSQDSFTGLIIIEDLEELLFMWVLSIKTYHIRN